MGISKKKIRKAVKGTTEEFQETVDNKQRLVKEAAAKKAQANSVDLFTTNTKKEGLKVQREKLRSDRFKQIQHSKTSKTDEKLIKRYAGRMAFRETQGLEPVQKKAKTTNNTLKEECLEDLMDIWSTPAEVKSKKI
jgi:hypothetical protein